MKPFVIMIPPPNVTKPHVSHALATLEDIMIPHTCMQERPCGCPVSTIPALQRGDRAAGGTGGCQQGTGGA